ncbi:MAG TPA: hypothetical protein VGZ93_04190 [Candidatus Methylacidiphilales bacterium]|jgi:hypothetical protein|nr:hypothetical protein [Candidatus Methylacidiphilales bacterium]
MIVVFSKDRAFQLEACLRTLLARCEDVADVPVRILWTASTPNHRQSYGTLRNIYISKPSIRIQFIEESNFRHDLISILGNLAEGSRREWLVRRLLRIGSGSSKPNMIQFSISSLLRPDPTVLFVVDDTLFLRSFRFAQCSKLLLANEACLAFSLRLGRGLTRFYMGNCDQQVPEMRVVDETLDIYQYQWTKAKGDFEYPLEISSSILNVNLILSRLLRKKWHSPNTLELALANMAGRYGKKRPMLLTFQNPRAVSAPLNIVQKDFSGNRHGGRERHHPDALCDLFLKGVRADLSRLDQVNLTSVHAEIDILPA